MKSLTDTLICSEKDKKKQSVSSVQPASRRNQHRGSFFACNHDEDHELASLRGVPSCIDKAKER